MLKKFQPIKMISFFSKLETFRKKNLLLIFRIFVALILSICLLVLESFGISFSFLFFFVIVFNISMFFLQVFFLFFK